MVSSIMMTDFMNVENACVLDVRESDEYAMGHIPGCRHIPLMTLEYHLQFLDKEKTYYVICHSGGRSHFACTVMKERGFNVINIVGGMNAYRGEMDYEM